jgi:hypothetical protein
MLSICWRAYSCANSRFPKKKLRLDVLAAKARSGGYEGEIHGSKKGGTAENEAAK